MGATGESGTGPTGELGTGSKGEDRDGGDRRTPDTFLVGRFLLFP